MGLVFERFEGLSLLLLMASGIAAAAWLAYFAVRWMASYPKMPSAGPETTDLGDEPPAIVNLLAHRWKVTRAAMAATFLDLAARRFISIDLLGRGRYVVRLRESPRGQLLPYEQQLLDLVRRRATGGSAPLEVIAPENEADAERDWKRFRKSVVSDARDRGLARNRWNANDLTVLGVLLAIPSALFALAMGQAGIGDGGSDPMTTGDWLLLALFAWGGLLVVIGRFQDVRDTPAGQEVCARWLGVRKAFDRSTAFGDAPPSHVILWERNLSHAAALGLAHDAVLALPFQAEDPETAWSRVSGHWRELRVEYPTRFGFGMKPIKAAWEGLWRTVVFGFISFVGLPFIANLAADVASSIFDSEQDYRLELLFLGLALAFVAAGTYVFVRFLAGLFWLTRALADLGKWVEEEGVVVKRANGRIAIDDGKKVELTALPPTAWVGLGTRVRVRRSPHLWYVEEVVVLEAPPALAEQAEATPSQTGQRTTSVPVIDIAAVNAATGLSLILETSIQEDLASFVRRHEYTDGAGNSISLNSVAIPEVAGLAGKILMRAASQASRGSTWAAERSAVIPYGDGIITVSVDLVDDSREQDVLQMVVAQLGG